MCHQHPARGSRLADGQRCADGRVVVGDIGIGQVVAHRGGPHKGQQCKFNGTVAVVQHDLARRTGETPGDVDALFGQQAAGEVKALGAVVVAGDRQHRNFAGGELGQEPVQQRAGGGGRHRRVVDIARQDHSLGAVFIAEGQNLVQNEPLILQHIKPVDPLAKVQVSQV